MCYTISPNFFSRLTQSFLPWAQITAYFVLLFFCIYLYLAPRFVDGQLAARTGNKGFVPYRGGALQAHTAGRVLEFSANEDGFWSVPITSRFPETVRIHVQHEDKGTWHEIVLNPKDIWTTSFWTTSFAFGSTTLTPCRT